MAVIALVLILRHLNELKLAVLSVTGGLAEEESKCSLFLAA